MEKPKAPLYNEWVLPNFGTFAAVFVILPSTAIIAEPFDLMVGAIIGLIAVVAIWVILVAKAPRIQISQDQLRVNQVSIPRSLIGEASVITKREIFSERGPDLNPAAHKVFQGTVKTAVKIAIIDPEDPTPYWLISTRHPGMLVELLRRS